MANGALLQRGVQVTVKSCLRSLLSKRRSPTLHNQRWLSSSSSVRERLRVAVVGAGPSGCYTSKYLSSSLNKQGITDAQLDVIERLPTPYGLVRYGVAPDHPEVKNVQNDFDALFEEHKNTIRFFGNVQVGRDVSVAELRRMYDVVVLAYGCESDRRLGLPGEEDGPFSGSILPAREFVAWYNGHPDFVNIGERVARALTLKVQLSDDDKSSNDLGVRRANVVVIGQGNVALDCARILSKGGRHLYDTDIASHSLSILGDGVEQISVVGRRGHVQAAFTIKELRELTKLEEEGFGTSFHVRRDELDLGMTDASKEELEGPTGRPKKRIHKLLCDVSEIDDTSKNAACDKHLQIRFLLSPSRFQPSEQNSSVLGCVCFERTTLIGEAGRQRAVGTGEFETIPADLVLVSIGYKGVALPGIEEFFDEARGVIRHEHGRVDGASDAAGGLYAAGWLKRGPSGIIGTNIADAKDTVATIMQDLQDSQPLGRAETLDTLLEERGTHFVRWEGYQKLDSMEKSLKRSYNQPREKIVDIGAQVRAALN